MTSPTATSHVAPPEPRTPVYLPPMHVCPRRRHQDIFQTFLLLGLFLPMLWRHSGRTPSYCIIRAAKDCRYNSFASCLRQIVFCCHISFGYKYAPYGLLLHPVICVGLSGGLSRFRTSIAPVFVSPDALLPLAGLELWTRWFPCRCMGLAHAALIVNVWPV